MVNYVHIDFSKQIRVNYNCRPIRNYAFLILYSLCNEAERNANESQKKRHTKSGL